MLPTQLRVRLGTKSSADQHCLHQNNAKFFGQTDYSSYPIHYGWLWGGNRQPFYPSHFSISLIRLSEWILHKYTPEISTRGSVSPSFSIRDCCHHSPWNAGNTKSAERFSTSTHTHTHRERESIITMVVVGPLVAAAIFTVYTFLLSWRQVSTGNVALIERGGKYHRTLEPGWHFIAWPLDQVSFCTTVSEILLDVPGKFARIMSSWHCR